MWNFKRSDLKLSSYNIDNTPQGANARLGTAYFIFLAASFYLYEFILQVAPSVMAESMMKTFGVTGQGFGFISAFYFYAYAPTQLPAGVLYDRYGPRKLMTFAIILCALGSAFLHLRTVYLLLVLVDFLLELALLFLS